MYAKHPHGIQLYVQNRYVQQGSRAAYHAQRASELIYTVLNYHLACYCSPGMSQDITQSTVGVMWQHIQHTVPPIEFVSCSFKVSI